MSRTAHFGVATAGVRLAMGVAALYVGSLGIRRKPFQRQELRTVCRAMVEIGQIKLNLIAGKATPAPPVGPALGEWGANIAFFVKEYNALTSDKPAGMVCPVIVHIMSDKSFTLELKTPPTAALLHKAAGAPKGSGKAKIEIVGSITIDQLREIAETKLPDLNVKDIVRAMKIVHGTAVASGIKVDGYEEWLAEYDYPTPQSIFDRYGPGLGNLPEDRYGAEPKGEPVDA